MMQRSAKLFPSTGMREERPLLAQLPDIAVSTTNFNFRLPMIYYNSLVQYRPGRSRNRDNIDV